jgi:menaquinol-cytochrome c reductase iron-sulfur subunit
LENFAMAHDINDRTSVRTLTRRQFLTWISVALGGVGAALVGIPVISFLLAPLFEKPRQSWRPVGDADHFKIGETVQVAFTDPSPLPWAGVTAATAVWLRRESKDQFTAFAVNCSHLGCPVQWIPDGQLFLCPCHGGVYYANGTVAAGPPPRSLTTYNVRVNAGQVEILTQPTPIV